MARAHTKVRCIVVPNADVIDVELNDNEYVISVEAVLDGGYSTSWTRVWIEVE